MTDGFDDLLAFIGRVENLYTRKGLCPPFRLKEFAAEWGADGIDLAFCLEQIRVHLEKHSGQYRCGSGDKGMIWLDKIIRHTWKRLEPTRPPKLLDFEHCDEWIAE